MKVDYIIVGCGLAGIAFCEQLRANGKGYLVFDNHSQCASNVAGGLYNPVILRRFTSVWKSKEQLKIALPMYKNLESLLSTKLDYKVPVRRKLTSIEEQNNWFVASDKPELSNYMKASLVKNANEAITAPFSLGEVLKTGRIDTKALIIAYKKYLKTNKRLFEDEFDYNLMQFNGQTINYKDITTRNIVFAEGYGIKKNPFFKNLPLQGTKGELLTIHAPNLKLDYVLKSSVFIIPMGNNHYRIGSTYDYEDKTNTITEAAKEELLSKLKKIITSDFKVIEQVAGIRPTVSGRRPLVGRHEKYKNLYVLNGLGTRGVMIGPYVASKLYHFIENSEPLDPEIDCSRYF